MKSMKNMGTVDRIIRSVVVLAVAGLYFAGVISGLVATILGILAAFFLVTSVVSFCPLYVPFGLSTRSRS